MIYFTVKTKLPTKQGSKEYWKEQAIFYKKLLQKKERVLNRILKELQKIYQLEIK